MRTNTTSVGTTIDVDNDNAGIASSSHGDILEDVPSSEASRPSKTDKKIVRFCDVHLREYDLCLGDNPSVHRGAPLALDWNVKTELKYSIEAFEESEHSGVTPHPTAGLSLKRPSLERLHVLKDLGYSRQEIKEAMDEVHRIKMQRFKTIRQVERSDRTRAFLNAITRFFRSSHNCCDPNEKLNVSVSTVSTRGSIDWSTISTGVAHASPPTGNKYYTKTRRSGRTKKDLKQDWQTKIQKHWEQRKWRDNRKRRTHRDSLDLARHPKLHSIDLLAPHPSVKSKEEADEAGVDNA